MALQDLPRTRAAIGVLGMTLVSDRAELILRTATGAGRSRGPLVRCPLSTSARPWPNPLKARQSRGGAQSEPRKTPIYCE
jgi:hypothetical protein